MLSPWHECAPTQWHHGPLAASAVAPILPVVLVVLGVATGCGASPDAVDDGSGDDPISTVEPTPSAPADASTPSTFSVDVWADNWMAVYVDGELIGEDSVSITTERSFNAETFTFEAAYPFTIAIEAKDFKETDSGIELHR